MNTIALFNHKGGVGKTTLTKKLADLLSQDYCVGVIDCDPQASLSRLYDIDVSASVYTNLERWMRPTIDGNSKMLDNRDIVASNPLENLYIIPSHLDVGVLDYQLSKQYAGLFSNDVYSKTIFEAIPKLILKFKEQYSLDFILLDLSPSVGMLNHIILRNCVSKVLSPYIAGEPMSEAGLLSVLKFLENIFKEKTMLNQVYPGIDLHKNLQIPQHEIVDNSDYLLTETTLQKLKLNIIGNLS